MKISCPACRATLEPDEIDRDLRECPLCSASLSDADLAAVEDQLGDADEEAIAGNPLAADRHHDSTESLAIVDADSTRQVEIIERTRDRLVVHLPPSASGSSGLGFFVILWNGFMVAFSTMMFFILRKNQVVEMLPIVFAGAFWLIGLGLAISWVRLRFTRLYLLLEKDRLVIQRKLLRTTNRDLPLGPVSSAVLEQSYTVNDVPVYAITVRGLGRNESFGAGLTPGDKDFLTREINSFLGVETASLHPTGDETVCSFCGTVMAKKKQDGVSDKVLCQSCRNKSTLSGLQPLWQPLRANGTEDLPDGLFVDESHPDQVDISYPLFPTGKYRQLAFTIIAVLATVWGGILFFMFGLPLLQGQGEIGIGQLLIPAIVSLQFMFVLAILPAIIRGKVRIKLATDLVTMSWGWGPVSIQKRFLPETITESRIMGSDARRQNPNSSNRVTGSPVAFAAIKAAGTPYPLITFHGVEYGQKVIRLVRTYLEQVTGRKIPD